jgi:serine/threonine protein phosphatase 1
MIWLGRRSESRRAPASSFRLALAGARPTSAARQARLLALSRFRGPPIMSSWREQFLDHAARETVAGFARVLAAAKPGGKARTYAIGDVHGCADLLIALLADICAAHPVDRPCKLMFLGDLVDRGPESAKTVAMVRALEELTPAGAVECLRGNHEQMMIDWIREGDDLWLPNGGFTTIESFAAADALADAAEWMDRLPTWREDERHIYVHAGLSPRRPYHRQNDQDRLWIREGFLDVEHDFGKHVIHGHTPQLDGPERRPFRTNIDTGAVYGGALTAAVLDETSSAPLGFLCAPA